MNYIVFDLEWNQGTTTHEQELRELPFEIIEIGAVKLNEQREVVDTFDRLIRPQVYHEMFRITGKLIGLTMKDLETGDPFQTVVADFLDWCGEEHTFVTWGTSDLPELQRNMDYYGLKPIANGPLAYMDAQKLFSIACEDGRSRRSLEHAVEALELPKDRPFHRAIGDALYTADVFMGLPERVLRNISYDNYIPPQGKRQEIHVIFDTYAKYISREFETKDQLLGDHEVTSTRCYLCHKNLRRKVRWFTPNGRNYYAIAYCAEHGFMKAKVRVRKAEDGGYYAVKTTKFIPEEDVAEWKIKQKKASRRHTTD